MVGDSAPPPHLPLPRLVATILFIEDSDTPEFASY